jgi:methionyl-tRNA synthetase
MSSLMGVDGVRYVVLREVPFDRDADVSYDGFIRRYNADLANDFGNLLNRSLNMVSRYLDGERPAPTNAELADAWSRAWTTYVKAMDAFLLHDALGALWEFVGEANRFVDREQPWALAKQAKAGDAEAADRLRGVLGDLLEACRVIALAAAPVIPGAAARVQHQLGLAFGYAANGSGELPLDQAVAWANAPIGGKIGTAEILFPRVENDPA